MARRRGIRKNKQFAWATVTDVSTDYFSAFATSDTAIIVAGGSDIGPVAAGGMHANLKRLILDVHWTPGRVSDASTALNNPTDWEQRLVWFVAIVDQDDSTLYDPMNATDLSDEKIVAHGSMKCVGYNVGTGGAVATNPTKNDMMIVCPELVKRQDVKSNRRITNGENLTIYIAAYGTVPIQNAFGGWGLAARALLQYPV